MYPTKIDCVDCNSFEDFERVKENVVKCAVCGKRHSDDSLYVIDPKKQYRRSEDGALLEVPP